MIISYVFVVPNNICTGKYTVLLFLCKLCWINVHSLSDHFYECSEYVRLFRVSNLHSFAVFNCGVACHFDYNNLIRMQIFSIIESDRGKYFFLKMELTWYQMFLFVFDRFVAAWQPRAPFSVWTVCFLANDWEHIMKQLRQR